MFYRAIGIVHRILKKLLGKETADYDGSFIAISEEGLYLIYKIDINKPSYFNDKQVLMSKSEIQSKALFYGENVGINIKVKCKKDSETEIVECNIIPEDPASAWLFCLKNSIVGNGFKNTGLCLNGYILDIHQFCLSSWIWTSAAVARFFVKSADLDRARVISEAFLREQQECGGWIVRYDFSGLNVYPMLAPNDSAYIANNSLLALYRATHEVVYLEGARKCASWIMKTVRPDGLVSNGFNISSSSWEDGCIIIDTGFTAGLFAS